MERDNLRPTSGKSKETSITIGPIKLGSLKVEELVYVEAPDDSFDLQGNLKRVMKKATNLKQQLIPPKFGKHAETVISAVYSDVQQLWNPNEVGDVQYAMQQTGYQLDLDETVVVIGKELGKNVSPKKILGLANDTFATIEGRQNANFQSFMLQLVKLRMGLSHDEENNS